jgi:hypothetical protein
MSVSLRALGFFGFGFWVACASGPETGLEESPFQELLDNGVSRYLGQITPSGVNESDGVRQYTFDSADGPVCMAGGPFTMATRAGSSDKLLIYLQGGGACWSTLCLAFEDSHEGIPGTGMLNQTLPGNPFADWNVGYLPYCDGSLFVGDVELDFDDDGLTDRYHRGLLNLTASLEVIREDFPDPPEILVTGLSAGAYGAPLAGMLVRSVWADVPITVLTDGGMGLGRAGDPGFILGILKEWGVYDMVPDSCEDCFADGHATSLTSWGLERDPNYRYLVISSYNDFVIGSLFLGVGDEEYEREIRAADLRFESAHPDQYASFLFNGLAHTTCAIDSTTDLSDIDSESLPFEGVGPGGAEQLDELLGRFDVTAIDGVTPANWLTSWSIGDVDFGSRVE